MKEQILQHAKQTINEQILQHAKQTINKTNFSIS